MATLHQDDFDRADSTNVPGTPTTGGPYTVRTGTWGTIGNQLYTSVSTAEAIITFPTAADCDLSATVTAGGVSAGIIHGWVSVNDFWLLQYHSGSAAMHRKVNGTYAQRGAMVATGMPVTLRLVVIGPIVRMYVNGTLTQIIDETVPLGIPAVSGFRSSSSIANRFDNVIAVDATSPGPATGGLYSLDKIPVVPQGRPGWILKGRDTKVLDTTSAP